MSNPKTPRFRFDCFACGHSVQTSKAPGSMIACPGCGVKISVPGRPDVPGTGAVQPQWTSPPPKVPSRLATSPARSPIGGIPPGRTPRRRTLGRVVLVTGLAMVVGTALFMWATHVPPIPPLESRGPHDPSVGTREPLPSPDGEVIERPPAPPSAETVLRPVDRVPVDTSPPKRLPAPKPAPVDRLTEFRSPRSAEEIRSTLKAILEEPAPPGMTSELAAALRRLKAYRYLSGVPYRALTLDEHLNQMATAAADICWRLGSLSHNPANPRLPLAQYERAHQAAASSNLAEGPLSLAAAVDLWMDDSDENNIRRLGHRRWCLNPSMGKTGMGRVDRFSAMWVFDRADAPFAEFTFIGYPCPGLMPVDFFPARTAWSIMLNPRDYRPPHRDRVEVRLYRVENGAVDRARSLVLDFFSVDTARFGRPDCVIFRPRSIPVEDGQQYWVEVNHLEFADGVPTRLEYLVEFIR